jgi:hypothetical protein
MLLLFELLMASIYNVDLWERGVNRYSLCSLASERYKEPGRIANPELRGPGLQILANR